MTAKDLNLDAVSLDELHAFAVRCGSCRCNTKMAKELFPERQPGYRHAADGLSHYAWNKYTAMRLRLEGHVNIAVTYEAICDRIYRELPEWAKGW